jgi:hypothetical protein
MSKRDERRFGPSLASLTCAAALLSGGCSVLFHADADQCVSNTDCTVRGTAFASHICVAGTCIVDNKPDAGKDGGGGSDASMEAGPMVVDSGSDVEVGPPPCKTNSDCIPDPQHGEVACDRSTGACLQLTTDECPLVIGRFDNPSAPPIFIGAFAELPPSGLMSHPSYINYAMAIGEFSDGIPGTNPSTGLPGLRTPCAVICNGSADSHVAMTHLLNEVHVPGVVAALDALTLKTLLSNDAYPTSTFVINPFGADSQLTSVPNTAFNASLFWHMLGQPGDVAPAYLAFFPHFESYVRAKQSLTAPMRVAVVTGNATVTSDLRAEVEKNLVYNGMSVTDNANASPPLYLNVPIESVLNNVDPSLIQYTAAVNALIAFKPNLIVSFAGPEFATLLQRVELQWQVSASNPSPYYLIGPYNQGSQGISSWIGLTSNTGSESRRTRVAGIGVASAVDTHVLDVYERNFPGPQDALGQENYYDSMYFAVYSLMAAGSGVVSPTGPSMAQGMLRLLSGLSKDMGHNSDMGDIESVLSTATASVSLFGTLGPPVFTLAKGTRIGAGSVYCVTRGADNQSPVYAYDVQRVSGTTDAGAPGLTGNFSCYSGL